MTDINTVIDANNFKNERILLFSREDSFIYFILKNDRIVKVYKENKADYSVGDIIVARVSKKNDSIGAYFCNIDKDTEVFLPFDECLRTIDGGRNVYKQGNQILVQIKKVAHDNKKALVSEKIELGGEFVVIKRGYQSKPISFSKKIASVKRNEIDDAFQETSNILYNLGYNILLRSKADNLATCEIQSHIDYMISAMNEIVTKSNHSTIYSVIKKADIYLKKYIDTLFEEDKKQINIIAESEAAYEYILKNASGIGIEQSNIRLYEDDTISLHVLYGLKKKFSVISEEKVMLTSGAYLFITPTPALVAIDVNVGKFDKIKDKENALLQVNIEAAREIAYQINARNISGIIIVDFINMKSKDNITILTNYMNKLFLNMKPTPKLVDFTKLGLAEITIEKKDDSIYGIIDEVNRTILI